MFRKTFGVFHKLRYKYSSTVPTHEWSNQITYKKDIPVFYCMHMGLNRDLQTYQGLRDHNIESKHGKCRCCLFPLRYTSLIMVIALKGSMS